MFLAGVVAALCLPAEPAVGAPYPAGAQRPARVARAFEAAHTSRAVHKKPSKHKSKKPKLPVNVERAQLAFAAMQKTYYIPGSGLYSGEPFSFLWPFSQAFAATVSMANIPSVKSSFAHEVKVRLVGLRSYLDTNNSGAPEGTFTSTLAGFDGTVGPPAGPGGTKYYDDNEWIGIELMRVYEQTHEAAVLGTAEGIMAFVMAGWKTAGPKASRSRAREAFPSPTPPKTANATRSPTVPRLSWRSSCTRPLRIRSTCSSPRWPMNGCATA